MKSNAFSIVPLKQRITAVALCAGLALTQGCANYQVRIPDSDPLEKAYQGGLMQSFFWDALVTPEVMAAECQGQAINDVVVESNYLYDLASVVTLGVWMPIEVRYRCRAPDIDGGEFPE